MILLSLSALIHEVLCGPRHKIMNILLLLKYFNPRGPLRTSTAIFAKTECKFLLFLMHNALLFSISAHFYLLTTIFLFSLSRFSGANDPEFLCVLHIRTKKSMVLSRQIRALLQYAPPYFCIDFPSNKIAGCPCLYQ